MKFWSDIIFILIAQWSVKMNDINLRRIESLNHRTIVTIIVLAAFLTGYGSEFKAGFYDVDNPSEDGWNVI